MPTIGSIDTGNINFKAAKSIFESNKQPNQQENTAPVKPGISGMTPPETRARGQVVPVQPETRERGNTLIFTSPNLSSRDAEANLYTNVPCPPPQQYLHGKPLHSHALKPLPELPNPNMSQAQDNSELLPPMPKGPPPRKPELITVSQFLAENPQVNGDERSAGGANGANQNNIVRAEELQNIDFSNMIAKSESKEQ